jgi:hypothetical protein
LDRHSSMEVGLGVPGEKPVPIESLLSIFREDPLQPVQPKSACAGGRCQQAPLSPPMDQNSRLVLEKQPVTLQGDKSDLKNRFGLAWSLPSDGMLPDQPCLDIVPPPPKQS